MSTKLLFHVVTFTDGATIPTLAPSKAAAYKAALAERRRFRGAGFTMYARVSDGTPPVPGDKMPAVVA